MDRLSYSALLASLGRAQGSGGASDMVRGRSEPMPQLARACHHAPAWPPVR